MFPPHQILPGSFGIEWGMSREQCSKLLNAVLLKQSPTFTRFRWIIQEHPYEVYLSFDDHRKLERIVVDLHVSRYFWNDFTYEEVERILIEYQGHYERLIEHYGSILRPPDFSGESGMNGYPEDQGAGYVTYWNKPEGRIQVEFDQSEKEAPVYVQVACYPVRPGRPAEGRP